ncbi:type VI secretion system-associated protein TagF [Roseomonas sp. OT10]|uniref:type VI secretion system-associated protein TagF n=1 Tax=Roseomonas cutis TaxID=2897332 RepID=UPI001E515DCF|nr:type VI secretion system-associated protein TagF [Roseomonas sp. OT10]UFN47769.1 type VI secretion system-associated protein TagF [Roseomonas sp. OT10]
MTPAATGLYGKMPAHGDFVRRGLPAGFVAPWDAWLQSGMAAARAALGEGWEAAWDAAPRWRFALPAGACGPGAVAGLLATSRDSVGRRFPLTLAALRPDERPPGPAWFAALEALAADALAGTVDADALAAALPPPEGEGEEAPGWWTEALEWPLPVLPDSADFTLLLDAPT